MSKPALRLYGYPLSGHSHRVQLFLSLLGLPYELVEVDLAKGEQRKPAFLALNPLGQVPVLEDGELALADSNAILVYLARRYDASGRWLPQDAVGAARVQQWLSLAAGPLAAGPAAARLVAVFGLPLDRARAEAVAASFFAQLERHLADRLFLLGAAPSIADLAHYSYCAHAPEGGIALEPWPAVRAWLARVEALAGFVAMRRSPAPAAA